MTSCVKKKSLSKKKVEIKQTTRHRTDVNTKHVNDSAFSLASGHMLGMFPSAE